MICSLFEDSNMNPFYPTVLGDFCRI